MGTRLTDYHGARTTGLPTSPLSHLPFGERASKFDHPPEALQSSRYSRESSLNFQIVPKMTFVARVGQLRRTSYQLPRRFLLSQQTAFVRQATTTALVPQRAWISNSSLKAASAVQTQSESGSALSASGKVRREVVLPSQEKKEGAMQYAL